jgi:hypothetical protein
MNDPFATYALHAIPAAQQRRDDKAGKPKTAFDLLGEERQRLAKTYRLQRRKLNADILAREPRLRDFARYLKKAVPGELLDAVKSSWLTTAPEDVQHYALRLVGARCDKINAANGFAALDDPLPPETSMFFKIKGAIGAR